MNNHAAKVRFLENDSQSPTMSWLNKHTNGNTKVIGIDGKSRNSVKFWLIRNEIPRQKINNLFQNY